MLMKVSYNTGLSTLFYFFLLVVSFPNTAVFGKQLNQTKPHYDEGLVNGYLFSLTLTSFYTLFHINVTLVMASSKILIRSRSNVYVTISYGRSCSFKNIAD